MLSSLKTPCPVCGRKSSGCKWDDDLLYCRIGHSCSPLDVHPQLKVGDVVADGWACVKINLEAECTTFKRHAERQILQSRQWEYFTPAGKRSIHKRIDYTFGPKDMAWSKGTKTDELLPLWYDELPDAGEIVFVVEGESCAEALRALGLHVTSVPNGSGSWRSQMPDMPKLAANRLILCPDRDRPGIELMERLSAAFPGSRWLWPQPSNTDAWDDPSDGYDVADWVADGASKDSLRAAVRMEGPTLPQLPWYERIGQHHTSEGRMVKPKALALKHLIDVGLGPALRFNSLKRAIEIDGRCMDESDLRLAYVDLQHSGIDVQTQTAQDALLSASMQRPYHPIRQYLDSCTDPLPDVVWDNIAGELLGGDAQPFDNSALRKWLIFAVARIYEPGCPCGFVHILAGDQHLHKTRFYNTLASEPWFYEGFIKSNKDADDIVGLHMRWIAEWGELDGGIKNHESAGLKNFITRKTDLVREAYGKGHQERPRQFVLCGTTNKHDGFFSDETGNRRFVIYTVESKIDSEKIEDLRDRIWSSARRDYLAGAEWYLNGDETEINNARNRHMYAEDAWRDKIAVWLSVRRFEYVLGSDVLTNCLEIPIERQDYRALTRVNRVLRSLGYYKTRKDLSGEFKTIWRKSV
jgi:predicted P-loop ATPase